MLEAASFRYVESEMRFLVLIALSLLVPTASAATLADAHRAWEARSYAEAFQAASFVADEDKTGEALYIISRIHDDGYGVVERNKEYALELLRQSADRGYPVALSVLGMAYFDGDGVERNVETAKDWWLKAAAKNEDGAFYNLAVVYNRIDRNYPEAVKWLRRAIDAGNVDAMKDLARLTAQGNGVPKDIKESVNLMRRAAIAGDQGARQLMVEYYVNGTGVTADPVRAQAWALIAERKGDGISPEGRGVLDRLLTPEKRTEAERLADKCLAAAKDCP